MWPLRIQKMLLCIFIAVGHGAAVASHLHSSTTARGLALIMGAQYSTGTVSREWKGWLEERCSLEIVRAIYKDFQAVVSSRKDKRNDEFFVRAEEFRQVIQGAVINAR